MREKGNLLLRFSVKLITTVVVVFGLSAIGLLGYYFYVSLKVKSELSGTYTRYDIESSGLMRSFAIYQPDSLKSAVPLLLALHGSRGSGDQIRRSVVYEFDQYADEFGFLVAYPTGFENHWNDCRKNASYSANQYDVDDVRFLRELVSYIGRLGINVTRVHVIGHSNGGHMAYRLALEAPDLVDGVTAVSASLPNDENLGCTPSGQPVQINILNGTEDKINPYEGGVVELFGDSSRGEVLSSIGTAEYWADLAGIRTSALHILPETDGNHSTSVEVKSWARKDGFRVKLYTLRGSGHVIPARDDMFPRIIGPSAGDVSAAAIVAQDLSATDVR